MGRKCGFSETNLITGQHGLTILIKENIEGTSSIAFTRRLPVLFICKSRFEYLTPRIRLTQKDLEGTKLEKPKILHFICSPSRALLTLSEVKEKPITIFEPIPVRFISYLLPLA